MQVEVADTSATSATSAITSCNWVRREDAGETRDSAASGGCRHQCASDT